MRDGFTLVNKYSTGKITKVMFTLVISYTKIEVVVFFEVSLAKLIGVSWFVKIISSLSKDNEWEIDKCSMLQHKFKHLNPKRNKVDARLKKVWVLTNC